MKKDIALKILKNSGYKNIVEINMKPLQFVAEHCHNWDVDLIILKGSLKINIDSCAKMLLPGDRFRMKKNINHSELSGENGVKLISARPERI